MRRGGSHKAWLRAPWAALAPALAWGQAPGFVSPPPTASSPTAGWPKPLPTPALAQGDTETQPTSRALLSVMGALQSSRFSEASLRAAGAGSTLTTFALNGATVALQSMADATAPRLALAPTSGAAFLIKLPATAAGLGSGDPARDPAYALASTSGTRIRIWAFYRDLPSDAVLSRRMTGPLLGVGAPLMTFDPTFTPGPGTGLDRYLLK